MDVEIVDNNSVRLCMRSTIHSLYIWCREMNAQPEIVTMCVCTHRRPKMLRACLESLAAQIIPADIAPQIVVIDNESEPNNRANVEAFATDCPFPVHYIHQPKRGIAAARNAALDTATELKSAWIAMLDDDETASPNWLAELMAPEYRQVPILSGKQVFLFPDRDAPFWHVKREKPRKAKDRNAQPFKFTYTNNVRFSTAILRDGLRFNEAIGLMGGEDPEFFFAAFKAGARIAKNDRAVTFETVHPERLTYRGQLKGTYWYAAGEVRQLAIEESWKNAILKKGYTIPLSILFGLLEVAASPIFAATGLRNFKRRALAGGKKVARGAGRAAAMLGRMPKPYQTTVGS